MRTPKVPLTPALKDKITALYVRGRECTDIARELDVDARQISGFLRSQINMGKMSDKGAPPTKPVVPVEVVLSQALMKVWRKKVPDAVFGITGVNGQTLSIAAYGDGVAITIDGQKKTGVLLSQQMALRLGVKLNELANWNKNL